LWILRLLLKKAVEITTESLADLTTADKVLVEKAQEATQNSYAPYSEFYVGSSVQLSNGEVVLGSNQENASFPSGLCAERVALFYCGQELEKHQVDAIAVFARSNKYKVPALLVPCAGCLQVMKDIEMRQNQRIRVLMWSGGEDVYIANGIEQFLPFHFSLDKQ
jgi:cytidine deaminase